MRDPGSLAPMAEPHCRSGQYQLVSVRRLHVAGTPHTDNQPVLEWVERLAGSCTSNDLFLVRFHSEIAVGSLSMVAFDPRESLHHEIQSCSSTWPTTRVLEQRHDRNQCRLNCPVTRPRIAIRLPRISAGRTSVARQNMG